MENYKIYLKQIGRVLIILTVIWFIWHVGKDWLRPRIIKQLGGFTAREYKETIDTIQHTIDTFYMPSKERIVEVKVGKPSVTTSNLLSSSFNGKVTNLVFDSINKIDPQTPVYTYNLPLNDSLIEGVINTTSTGKIITQSLNYKPKFPIFIKETISVEKNKEQTLYDKSKAYFGIGITGTTNKDVGGLLIYQTPKKIQVQAGYTRNLDNPLLQNTNKGIVSVSLIKLF